MCRIMSLKQLIDHEIMIKQYKHTCIKLLIVVHNLEIFDIICTSPYYPYKTVTLFSVMISWIYFLALHQPSIAVGCPRHHLLPSRRCFLWQEKGCWFSFCTLDWDVIGIGRPKLTKLIPCILVPSRLILLCIYIYIILDISPWRFHSYSYPSYIRTSLGMNTSLGV